jgi:hypothetical protein
MRRLQQILSRCIRRELDLARQLHSMAMALQCVGHGACEIPVNQPAHGSEDVSRRETSCKARVRELTTSQLTTHKEAPNGKNTEDSKHAVWSFSFSVCIGAYL